VAADFLLKIDRRFELLAQQPYIGALSTKVKDMRSANYPPQQALLQNKWK